MKFRYVTIMLCVILLCGCVGNEFSGIGNILNNSNVSNPKKIISDIYNKLLHNNTKKSKFELGEAIRLKIGESVEYKGVNVTVENAVFSEDLREFKTFKPLDKYFGVANDDFDYLVIDVKIRNTGNESIYTTAHDFIVIDSKGNMYSYSTLTHAFEDALQLKRLKNGESSSGKIVFAVPKTENEFRICYCFGSLADFKSVFTFFRNKWAVWIVRR